MTPNLPALALLPRALQIALAALAAQAVAQPGAPTAPAAVPPQTIVISGGVREAALLEAPYAITHIGAAELRSAGPMVNLSEALARVPGLVAANRNNYAQDLQVSARGFGARAGFGVRGVRLYADGIPATMPDGQGQVAHFDLAGAQRVEVLRGPFSALYGNSSGGVIALFTAPAREGRAEAGFDTGSFGLAQARVAVAAPLHSAGEGGQGLDLKASASHMQLRGFRPQSEARRSLGQWRLGWTGPTDTVTLLVSHHEQRAQDPLGLSRAQFSDNARQTTPQALQFNTRKTVQQTQAGLRWRHAFDEGALRETTLAIYQGQRAVLQWLAIAPATQAGARHGGGVIDLQRRYGGADVRALWRFGGQGGIELATGAVQEMQTDERQGFENFIGTGAAQQLGVTGRLRRDETNRARTREVFAQLSAPLAPALQLHAGVRSGQVQMSVRDRFLGNGDDSGDLGYRYTQPVLGLQWTLAPAWRLHGSVARGFESPTLGELAYRADGSAGFNSGLRGQKSTQAELGSKWRGTAAGLALEIDATVFSIRTRDEIGVQSNAGGRSSFQNVGRTARQGLELAAAAEWPAGWRSALALTVLQARYQDAFLACAGLPCAAATVPVPAGNRIAGTQRGSLWAEVQTPQAAWGRLAMEWRAAARTAANDTNTDWAPGHATLNLRWTRRYSLGGGLQLEALARVDNLTGKSYAGSVIVNDANGRFYEPAAPRQALLALRLQQAF